jgi:glycosyltransferase involved in cell wall biosynthesis
LRLAVVTPFIDRQHGTERALAELLDRLRREHACEIHLYAERIADLAATPFAGAPRSPNAPSLSRPPQEPVILSRPQEGEGSQLPPRRPIQQKPPEDANNAPHEPQSGSITWHRVPSLPGPHLFKFLFWVIANTAMRWWDRVAHSLRFDLVLSPGINCLDADFVVVHALFHRLRELSREERKPQSNQQSPVSGILRRLHRRAYYATVAALERIVYANRKTHLAAVSQRTADLLARYFGRNDVAVIFNGIDTVQFSVPARLARRQGARFRRKFSDSDVVLLLIGNDWRVKGLPTVLEAMSKVPDLPWRLIVVGSDAAANFQHTAQQLKIAERCHWESPRADVIDCYAAADIYVSPSHEDSFGLPVAEAMACGLPVITSKFAGVSELIQNERDGLVLSDPTDASVLADALRGLHANPSARTSLGDAAAVTAQTYTWDRNAAEVWKWLQADETGRQIR